MKLSKTTFFLFSLLLLLVLSCNLPSSAAPKTTTVPSVNDVVSSTLAAATLQAMTPLATPTMPPPPTMTLPPVTPTPTTGKVSGRVCYKSGASVPAMKIFFQDTATGAVLEFPVAAGQTEYEMTLPPGTYIAYAWLYDFSLGGSYSACLPGSGCGDHTPLPFTVQAGAALSGVDICDWAHGPFDVPYPPNYSPAATTGSIAGTVYHYPGSADARLTIVAFNQDTGYWYYFKPAAGGRTFSLDNLPPGRYQLVAYDTHGRAGGAPSLVTVVAGQTAYADVTNWNGSYPANPAP